MKIKLNSYFKKKVEPGMLLSKNIGNIYTWSLYIGLASLLNEGNLIGKRVLMFSYGSGLMSSMFRLRIR
jgi:hydroxymethylglutaryl-CoA synthase